MRDHLLLLITYRHGLRISEAVRMRHDELDLDCARLWVRRLKGGLSVEQSVAGDELRAIKRHLATRTDGCLGCSSPKAVSRLPARRSAT